MKKYSLIIIILFSLLANSCKKDFMNVDSTNPNNPSFVPPKLVLPTALVSTADAINYPVNFEFVYLWYGIWSIAGGYAPSAIMTTYNITSTYDNGIWSDFYLAAKNFDYIVQNSSTDDQRYFKAIGRTMKAYIFQNLVDIYGDVPYSQAFQTDKGNLKPVYDKQQDIYEDLVNQLDTAISEIINAPPTAIPPTAKQDIMFGGDMTLWRKFANTLKLRILLHQSDMTGRITAYIAGHITDSHGYLGVGEGAMVNPGYTNVQDKQSPFYDKFYDASGAARADGIAYYVANQSALDFLTNTNDPRLASFYAPGSASSGSYIGAYYGQTKDIPPASTEAIIGPGLLVSGVANKSSFILSDYESLFVQAEAAERGIIAGNAQTLYESAIKASFANLGLPDSVAVNFLANAASISDPKVDWTAAPNKLQLIINEKWASLNVTAPVETWTDYRRTGFPDQTVITFTQRSDKVGPGTPPVRLFYPYTEISVNNENELAAEKRDPLGKIDIFKSKIFWQNR